MSNAKEKSVVECHYLLKIKMPEEYQKKFDKWEESIVYKAPEWWSTGIAWREYIYYLNLNLPRMSKDNLEKYEWLKDLQEIYKNYIKT